MTFNYNYYPERREAEEDHHQHFEFDNETSTIGPNDSVSQVGITTTTPQPPPLPSSGGLSQIRERQQLIGARDPPPSLVLTPSSTASQLEPTFAEDDSRVDDQSSIPSVQRYSWIPPSQVPSAFEEDYYHHPPAVDPYSRAQPRGSSPGAEEAVSNEVEVEEGDDAYYDYRNGTKSRTAHASAELGLLEGAAGFAGSLTSNQHVDEIELGNLERGRLRTPSGSANSAYYSPVYGDEEGYIHPVGEDADARSWAENGRGEGIEEQGLVHEDKLNATNSYPPNQERSSLDPSLIKPAPTISRLFYDTTDQRRRIWEHERGIGIQKFAWASWLLALAMVVVLVVELVKMHSETGSVIATTPSFNVMIGEPFVLCLVAT